MFINRLIMSDGSSLLYQPTQDEESSETLNDTLESPRHSYCDIGATPATRWEIVRPPSRKERSQLHEDATCSQNGNPY